MRTSHNQSQSVFRFFSPSPLCHVREVFAIEFPCILVSNHTPSPRLCMSMYSGSTSFVSTSAITAALPPSFAHQSMRGDVSCTHVDNHCHTDSESVCSGSSPAAASTPFKLSSIIRYYCSRLAYVL